MNSAAHGPAAWHAEEVKTKVEVAAANVQLARKLNLPM